MTRTNLLISCVAALAASISTAHAASARTAPAGAVSSVRYFFGTPRGMALADELPSLASLASLSPLSEVHRRIAGALELPAELETRLDAAVQGGDERALLFELDPLAAALLSVTPARLSAAVQAAAEVVLAGLRDGALDAAGLSAAASDLAPFVAFSEKARQVQSLAGAARSAATLEWARSSARRLLEASHDAADANDGGPEAPSLRLARPLAPTSPADAVLPLPTVASAQPADLATLERLWKGYAAINGRLVYGGGNADAELLLKLNGRRLGARGILEARLERGFLQKAVHLYLKAEDGSRTVFLQSRGFFWTADAEAFHRSLPAGALVDARLRVSAGGGRLVGTGAFAVEELAPVPPPAPARAARAAAQDPAPAQAPPPVPVWGIVEVKEGQPDISAGARERLSAYPWSTGMLWWKRRFVTYALHVAPKDVPAFSAAGFKPLTELRVRVVWSRVSDLNGWGVGANGQVHRRAFQDITFSGPEIGEAFRLLREFERDPLALLSRYPEDEAYVRPASPVSPAERGYVVDSSIDVMTGHSWTNDELRIFENSDRSGYYR